MVMMSCDCLTGPIRDDWMSGAKLRDSGCLEITKIPVKTFKITFYCCPVKHLGQ
jgi:hypothetical protein